MNSPQSNNRRPQQQPAKMMRVAPVVTDPLMQNNRTQAEALLSEMGENADGVDEVVFNRKKPTREELEQQYAPSTSTDNTILFIIFALVVIALVAIIVWMIMKQGSDKKEEGEIRRMIQPQHPRNGMPQMNRYPVNQQQYNQMQARAQQQQMQQQMQMQQMQQAQQHANNEQTEDVEEEPAEEPVANAKASTEGTAQVKQAAPVPAKKATKPKVNASGTVAGITAEQKALSDKAEAEAEKAAQFTKDNPHPAIMKPGVVAGAQAAPQATSSVDDVMKRTEALLNSKKSSELTAADKALLDQIDQDSQANVLVEDDDGSDD
jgi:hypothetical protein